MSPLVGGRRIEYPHDNIQALSIRLTVEQIRFLESAKLWDVRYPFKMLGDKLRVTENEIITPVPVEKFPFVEHLRAVGYQ